MRLKRLICAVLAVCLALALVPGLERTAQAASPYYITVDLTNQIVTVYENGNVTESGIVRQMICSSGKPSTPTPKGTFTLPKKSRASERTEWYYFANSHCYAKWATRIHGGILFHSILFNSKKGNPTSVSVNALGTKASHGCVRLKIADAYWIAMNVPAGTKVKIFDGKKNSALHKLVLNKTFSRDSQTYDSYLGRAPKDPNVLARYSRGENVTKLQKRLKELGFLDGSADGIFGTATDTALKNYQAARGLSKTGTVNITTSDWTDLFADDAPTGTYATLKTGMSGPAVRVLQQALKDCKVYDGAVDGVFDADTAAAVRKYQSCFGYTANGVASSAMQQNAIARAANLRQQFGDAEYQMVQTTNPIVMGKVKPSTLYMRKSRSTRAKSVKKLKKNQRVRVLSRSGSWCRVKYGGKTGYVMKRYLSCYYSTETIYSYELVPQPETEEPTISIPEDQPYIPGADDQPYIPGAEGDGQVAAEPIPDPAARYAVALQDGVQLYAEPDADGEPVAVMSAGAALALVAEDGEWVQVSCEGRTLYAAAADVELIDAQPAGETVEPGTEPEPEAEPEAPAPDAGLAIEDVSAPDADDDAGVEIEPAEAPNE